ncbi:hypothetical protein ACIQZB_42295 [Streptomyces sp. NPDC097727]|uniref:hypothetical protein n=1 Tax=Streptomyces sp. NPDC097727 TaxID=3366092 RepID=UPI0037F84E6C
MLEELAPRCAATRESALRERRGGDRRRAVDAGRKQKLVFTDRLLVTLVHLRRGLPYAAPAQLYVWTDRRTGLRPLRPTRNPPQAKHGTGAWPASRLLINHQPIRQAGTFRHQFPPES